MTVVGGIDQATAELAASTRPIARYVADAGRDTFLIENLQGVPKHLLVLEEGQDDQRLDLWDQSGRR